MSEPLDRYVLTKREHKGKVARTHKSNTSDCWLTRSQFDRLPAHEKVNTYFATNISRKSQADFFNDSHKALEDFARTLSPR